MLKMPIFILLYIAIPQKKCRIFLISNLQENFRKSASIERNDETREFEVNKILAVALMRQRQRNRVIAKPFGKFTNSKLTPIHLR